jgi:hypothetical protein
MPLNLKVGIYNGLTHFKHQQKYPFLSLHRPFNLKIHCNLFLRLSHIKIEIFSHMFFMCSIQATIPTFLCITNPLFSTAKRGNNSKLMGRKKGHANPSTTLYPTSLRH